MRGDHTGALLRRLRAAFVPKNFSAYIVPSEDAHLSEYIAKSECRREFVSGFTGSAGTAVITLDKAALWTDGRYYTQAEQELDENWTLIKSGLTDSPTIDEWLAMNLPKKSVVGVDPKLISLSQFQTIESSLRKEGLTLKGELENLVDLVWDTRPAGPSEEIFLLSEQFTGKSIDTKVDEARKALEKKRCGALLLTALDDIAWQFNLRGADIPYNPVFFSYALISTTEAIIFLNKSQLKPETLQELESHSIQVKPYSDFFPYLKTAAAEIEGRIWIGSRCPAAIVETIGDMSKICEDVTYACHAKSIKNPVELEGMRNCHVRDAAALVQYNIWLESQAQNKSGAILDITEVDAADKLEGFRKAQEHYVSLSFATISSIGPNGAIIHYHPTTGKCAKIRTDQVYLCDSGGQYKDGTTDVTRTIHLGTPSDSERKCFTLVLKGHIALDRAIFPPNTTGLLLDSFARQHLWSHGLDYGHGTGHGVGSFLNVHEGPIGISFRPNSGKHPLKPGMIVTIEPGYYEPGNFGVRIENCVEVVEVETEASNNKFLSFEPITVFPLQAKMIKLGMLTDDEIDWIDKYHRKCRSLVGPVLEKQGHTDGVAWLEENTRPIRETAHE